MFSILLLSPADYKICLRGKWKLEKVFVKMQIKIFLVNRTGDKINFGDGEGWRQCEIGERVETE